MKENLYDLKSRAQKIIDRLHEMYPDSKCSLDYRNSYELLVATILSAQCTDARVNQVTPQLFAAFPSTSELAKASIKVVEKLIQSTGFYRNKAKSLLGMANAVERHFKGRIPETIEELTHLPGVGRKTANVVLGNAFDKPAGVVVDTHVSRLSQRLGLSRQKTPEKIERDLNGIIPQSSWTAFPHLLISHGRAVCKAQKPQCRSCKLVDLCPRKGLPKILDPQFKPG